MSGAGQGASAGYQVTFFDYFARRLAAAES
jgi:hypothetical protein